MAFLQIILISSLFSVIFITLHFLALYFFSLKKIIHIIFPFILSNIACFYFTKDLKLNSLFYDSFIINFSILIIYMEFLMLIKKGFTISIITSFKNKKKLFHKELIKSYGNGRGAKWILLDRLGGLTKLKIIKKNNKIILTKFGYSLSIILIFFRKILAIKDFG